MWGDFARLSLELIKLGRMIAFEIGKAKLKTEVKKIREGKDAKTRAKLLRDFLNK